MGITLWVSQSRYWNRLRYLACVDQPLAIHSDTKSAKDDLDQ